MSEKTTMDLPIDRRKMIKELQEQLGKTYFNETLLYVIDLGLAKIPFLSKELTGKLDKIFIEASATEKLNIVIDSFLKWHEKFPYLTVEKTITPEDAGFPLCPFVKALYWNEKLIGFHCRARRPPLNLPKIRVEKNLSFNYVTAEDCWICVELCKKQKLGIEPFRDISLEQIKVAKEEQKKVSRTEKEQIIIQKLEGKFRESIIEKAPKIFNYVTYTPKPKGWSWKGITKASRKLGISRMTIYEILKNFPDGQVS